ncbi:MAG: alpha-E domain-containing protein, partial [Verrucomicrobiales bacterium]
KLWRRQPDEFYSRVIKFCLLYEGLIGSTILHDEGWQFVQAGKFLERADKTSRILDMLSGAGSKASRNDMLSVLRSSSALTAFRVEFRGDITLSNVVSFLLYSPSFPRSARFCLQQVDRALHTLTGSPMGTYVNEVERLTGQLVAHINYAGIEDVWARGLHDYLDDFQSRLNEIGQQVFETYVLLPLEYHDPSWTQLPAAPWQQQQQQQ